MKSTHLYLLVAFVLLLSSCKGTKFGEEIITCGDDKLLIISPKQSQGEEAKVVWEWKVSDAVGQIPEKYQKLMIPLDDCKPIDNNNKILLTSSGGGAVLLDRTTKKCLFYADVPMAHSIEMLPNNKIVVALSTHPKGNSIELFDMNKPEQVLFRDSLYSGHGVVWMPKQHLLYALGYDVLRAYSLQDWNSEKPFLKLEKQWALPSEGGHDLVPISNKELIVTNHAGIFRFSAETSEFTSFEPLEGMDNIKSVNYDPESKRLIYTKAEISWWTHHIYLENPKQTFTIDSIKLYKVRTSR
ncbi:MAG: DUF6528 family protein [Phocaeicola sp.]|uniref:DUF6528 family protein n=1 Tax=Phocaeicola sp. TaxID=2773926 RepID=UPI003F9F4913